jgi:hypothetical protein
MQPVSDTVVSGSVVERVEFCKGVLVWLPESVVEVGVAKGAACGASKFDYSGQGFE